jgi:hypothetical protein
MPIYNEFYFANGYYGSRAPLQFSAEPVSAVALDYSTVLVSWNTPTGSYSDFRVVRNQGGFPQTQEDGAIIYSSAGAPSTSSFKDTADNVVAPLVSGRFVFYRTWVRISATSDWVQSGSTFTLVPSPHSLGLGQDAAYTTSSVSASNGYSTGDSYVYKNPLFETTLSTTHNRFMETLPRVITSSTNSSLDVVDDGYDRFADPTGANSNSLISAFFSAFSFTLDEFLTFAKLVTPDTSVHYSSPAAVFLGSQELGLSQDVEPVTSTQRLLLRNAVKIYSEKGTSAGLQLFVQDVTGYSATITDTYNLMLSYEDATFSIPDWQDRYNSAVTNSTTLPSVGNWYSITSNVTLSVASDQTPLTKTDVPRTLDTVYCAKVNPTVANQAIALGTLDPINSAIPVTAGSVYSLSFWAKEGSETEGSEGAGSDSVTAEIRWYDKRGLYISSSTTSLTVEGATWTRYSAANKTAPTKAVYAGIVLTFVSQTYPVYLDMFQFENSATVRDYQEPRGVIVAVNPTKINYIKNPGFQVDASGWSSANTSALSRAAANSYTGVGCLSAVSNGSGALQVYAADYIPVTVGQYYSGSIYIKDASTLATYTAAVKFYKSDNTLISTITGPPVSSSQVSWQRLTVSGKAPATSASARLYVQSSVAVKASSYSLTNNVVTLTTSAHGITKGSQSITLSGFSDTFLNGTFTVVSFTSNTVTFALTHADVATKSVSQGSLSWSSSVANGQVVYFDGAQFENTAAPTDYFDGYLTGSGSEWQGNAASAAYSGNYPARSNRLGRLKGEIESYIGFGTPYYVDTYSGPFTSGVS